MVIKNYGIELIGFYRLVGNRVKLNLKYGPHFFSVYITENTCFEDVFLEIENKIVDINPKMRIIDVKV